MVIDLSSFTKVILSEFLILTNLFITTPAEIDKDTIPIIIMDISMITPLKGSTIKFAKVYVKVFRF